MNPEVARLRRLSAQRKSRKQLRYVRALWGMAGVLLVVLVIEVLIALSFSPRFWIYRIEIAGTETLTRAEATRLTGLDPARRYNYYRVPLGRLAAGIRREPRVAAATVRRGPIGTLLVDVHERQAVCRLGYARPPLYLDAKGYLFTRPVAPTYSTPVVEGLTVPITPKMLGTPLTAVPVAHVLQCLATLREASPDSPLEVARVVVTTRERMMLVLRQGTKIFIGEPKDFAAKAFVLGKTVVAASNQGYALGQLEYIDVSVISKPTDLGAVYRPKQTSEGGHL